MIVGKPLSSQTKNQLTPAVSISPFHHHSPVYHDSRLQIAADYHEHPVIADASCESPHQYIVIDAVEELLQIHVHHPPASFLNIPLRGTNCSMRVPSRSKTVAVPGEAPVVNGNVKFPISGN